MKTALGNGEGPSSQELWEKLEKIEEQNKIMLLTMDAALAEVQSSFRGIVGQRLRQLHSNLRTRIMRMEGVPNPDGEG